MSSAWMKLFTQTSRSGGGKAIYHDVLPKHIFHRQQCANNADANKSTSYSFFLCFVFCVLYFVFCVLCFVFCIVGFVFDVSRSCFSRFQYRVVCLRTAGMDS